MIWEMIYNLKSPIQELAIKGHEKIEGFKIISEESSGSVKLIGFVLLVEAFSDNEAKEISQLKANRVYDYLTSIHNVPINGYLAYYRESKQESYSTESDVKIKWDQLTAKRVDLSVVEKMTKWGEIKLMRQLSHYRIGLKASDDIVTQIREFYLIVEDEYGDERHPKHGFLSRYKGIRDLVYHPKINNPDSSFPDGMPFAANYLDLSNPKAIEELRTYAQMIKKEANKIIESKITEIQ